MEIDYLIIGQGLAGSLLAWELIQRDKKIVIVDNNQLNASQVAAGLINPVTGMRFVKSANVDKLLPSALEYYQKLSLYFQQDFYIEKSMLRLLRNDKEIVACTKRFKDSEYQNYLTEIIPESIGINASHGILKQNNTGYLLTPPLLEALKGYFISHNAYIKTDLHYDEINLSPTLRWKNFKPKQIIFCEGHLATKNPWFSVLPFQLVKGEIITALSKQVLPQAILNYGHWFIPLDKHQFRTGASFDRDNIDTNISDEVKSKLFDSLQQVYPTLAVEQIIKHQAGIRPTTQDKMPFIGQHPHYPNLFIFNGFGAKGSLQIPWHCQNLADNLLNNQAIEQSSNINRYHSLFL